MTKTMMYLCMCFLGTVKFIISLYNLVGRIREGGPCASRGNWSAVLRVHFIKPLETGVVSWIPRRTTAGASLTLSSAHVVRQQATSARVGSSLSHRGPTTTPSCVAHGRLACQPAVRSLRPDRQSVTGRLRAKSDPIGEEDEKDTPSHPPGHLWAGLS